mmetsp:Transcript_39799/g.87372  ORF Transcript_39799/g.87372 Transcript_39799/m.87372 type:complete len:327 (+) Transcript_39799:1292-2272(+)
MLLVHHVRQPTQVLAERVLGAALGGVEPDDGSLALAQRREHRHCRRDPHTCGQQHNRRPRVVDPHLRGVVHMEIAKGRRQVNPVAEQKIIVQVLGHRAVVAPLDRYGVRRLALLPLGLLQQRVVPRLAVLPAGRLDPERDVLTRRVPRDPLAVGRLEGELHHVAAERHLSRQFELALAAPAARLLLGLLVERLRAVHALSREVGVQLGPRIDHLFWWVEEVADCAKDVLAYDVVLRRLDVERAVLVVHGLEHVARELPRLEQRDSRGRDRREERLALRAALPVALVEHVAELRVRRKHSVVKVVCELGASSCDRRESGLHNIERLC